MIDALDMSGVLDGFEQSVILRTKTITTVDFVETEVETDEDIEAVVQLVDNETKVAENLDFSKKYQMIHSTTAMAMNQYIVYDFTEYKIVRIGNNSDYGFYEAIGEEVK